MIELEIILSFIKNFNYLSQLCVEQILMPKLMVHT